ncbi:MAG: hypothetical protein ACJ75B_11535 [Flavisolibacter sp.]
MKKTFILLITVFSLVYGCKKDTKLVTRVFPKQQWIGGLSSIFTGMKLHLNNYTPIKHNYEQDDNYAYDNPNSSSLSIPSLGIVPWAFDVPVTRNNPYSIYLNDINSTRFTTDAHDGYAYITINFESDGTEIIGDCVNNIICVCGSPKMDLGNIVTSIPLAFVPKDGAASVGSGDVSFSSDVAETGPCVNNACAFFCEIFAPNRNTDMQKAIQNYIGDFIDQNSGLISTPFTQYLKTLGVSGAIVAIQIKPNGDLMVEDKE